MRLASRLRQGILITGIAVGVPAAPCAAADEAVPPAASPGGILMVQVGPTAVHWNSSPDYHGTPWLVGAEWQTPSRWIAGLSVFNNSFDQVSYYGYGGYWWRLGGSDSHEGKRDSLWYLKVTGGIIQGYHGQYEDKIPFNQNGFAPAIVPALGYKTGRFNAQFNLVGSAGFLITFGYDLIR